MHIYRYACLLSAALALSTGCRSFRAADYATLAAPSGERAAPVGVPRDEVRRAFGDFAIDLTEEEMRELERQAKDTTQLHTVNVQTLYEGRTLRTAWDVGDDEGRPLDERLGVHYRVDSTLSEDTLTQLELLDGRGALRVPARLVGAGPVQLVPTHHPTFSRNFGWVATAVLTAGVATLFGSPTTSKTVSVGWALRVGDCVVAYARGEGTTYAAWWWGYSTRYSLSYHYKLSDFLNLSLPSEHTRSAVAAANEDAWRRLLSAAWAEAEPGRCVEVPEHL